MQGRSHKEDLFLAAVSRWGPDSCFPCVDRIPGPSAVLAPWGPHWVDSSIALAAMSFRHGDRSATALPPALAEKLGREDGCAQSPLLHTRTPWPFHPLSAPFRLGWHDSAPHREGDRCQVAVCLGTRDLAPALALAISTHGRPFHSAPIWGAEGRAGAGGAAGSSDILLRQVSATPECGRSQASYCLRPSGEFPAFQLLRVRPLSSPRTLFRTFTRPSLAPAQAITPCTISSEPQGERAPQG